MITIILEWFPLFSVLYFLFLFIMWYASKERTLAQKNNILAKTDFIDQTSKKIIQPIFKFFIIFLITSIPFFIISFLIDYSISPSILAMQEKFEFLSPISGGLILLNGLVSIYIEKNDIGSETKVGKYAYILSVICFFVGLIMYACSFSIYKYLIYSYTLVVQSLIFVGFSIVYLFFCHIIVSFKEKNYIRNLHYDYFKVLDKKQIEKNNVNLNNLSKYIKFYLWRIKHIKNWTQKFSFENINIYSMKKSKSLFIILQYALITSFFSICMLFSIKSYKDVIDWNFLIYTFFRYCIVSFVIFLCTQKKFFELVYIEKYWLLGDNEKVIVTESPLCLFDNYKYLIRLYQLLVVSCLQIQFNSKEECMEYFKSVCPYPVGIFDKFPAFVAAKLLDFKVEEDKEVVEFYECIVATINEGYSEKYKFDTIKTLICKDENLQG